MGSITRAKLEQAVRLVQKSGLDVWLTFVRETVEGCDPVLPLILEGGLTWQSALFVTSTGKKIAIVGNYDADALIASGDWDEVIPYVQGIQSDLVQVLEREVPSNIPRIGVNYSTDDCKADGLSHGMFMLLRSYLQGTRFSDSLESAESVVTRLRAHKTEEEIARMKQAIAETNRLFDEIPGLCRLGVSELDIQQHVHRQMTQRGLGFAWDRVGNPIVNFGPDSMIGHGIPSAHLKLEPGMIVHLDLGVIAHGYASDIQRCWFVGDHVPEDVELGLRAVVGAIRAGAEVLRPGVQGWQVDEAARTFLIAQGYPEYLHAFGHQVGRIAHDGGAVLGPRWERYGRTPCIPIESSEVYTLELGVTLPGRGYLGLEEMVRVTDEGLEWLTEPQTTMPLITG